MKTFIFILFFGIIFCQQTEEHILYWCPSPPIDSVTFYELYVVENEDSLFLESLNFQIDSTGASNYLFLEIPYQVIDSVIVPVILTSDGKYVFACVRAINNYGNAPFSEKTTIIRKGRKLPPGKSCWPGWLK